MRESRRLLEARLGGVALLLSERRHESAVSAVVAETYRSAVGTVRGIARCGDDPYLPRLPVPPRLEG
jgi:hypothetical protein